MIATPDISTPQQQRAMLERVRVIMRYLYYKQQFLKYPTVPADEIKSLSKTKAIKDTTANGLTAAVVLLIELLGGYYWIAKDLPNTFDWITTTCEISESYLHDLLTQGKRLFKK